MIRARDDFLESERHASEPPGHASTPPRELTGAVESDGVRGWSLPLALSEAGATVDTRPSPLEDTARLVLEVVPGERRLLPEFGCRVHLLESVRSESARQLAAALVEEALDRWAPTLGVDRADVAAGNEGRLRVRLWVAGVVHELEIAHRNDRHEEAGK